MAFHGTAQIFVLTTVILVHTLCSQNENVDNSTRYNFYRLIPRSSYENTKRTFGGVEGDLSDIHVAAVLLDRFWLSRCSCAVISQFWALTAAHCVIPSLTYIKYNTRSLSSNDGNFSVILLLFRHPNYKVVQEDDGKGPYVTFLQHDIGLIKSKDKMDLIIPPQPLENLVRYHLLDLETVEVTMLGFGKIKRPDRDETEELLSVNQRIKSCRRPSWINCVCGGPTLGTSPKVVCSGDSGGPVMFEGVLVGITTMGPLECGSISGEPGDKASSVFTLLYKYFDFINATIIADGSESTRHYSISAYQSNDSHIEPFASHKNIAEKKEAVAVKKTYHSKSKSQSPVIVFFILCQVFVILL